VIEPEHLCLPRVAGSARPTHTSERPVETKAPTDLKSLERTHILETLASVNGVRKAAAERLGMSERTLRYKLQQYRLDGAEPPAPPSGYEKKQ